MCAVNVNVILAHVRTKVKSVMLSKWTGLMPIGVVQLAHSSGGINQLLPRGGERVRPGLAPAINQTTTKNITLINTITTISIHTTITNTTWPH